VNRFAFWHRWLLVVAGGITAFGLLMALLVETPLFEPFHAQVDPAFWAGERLPLAALGYRGWALSAWGATVAGWGLLLTFVVRGPFYARQPWVWPAIAVSLGLWFVLDTVASLRHGVAFNVGLNVAIFVLAAIPLLATRKAFFPSGERVPHPD